MKIITGLEPSFQTVSGRGVVYGHLATEDSVSNAVIDTPPSFPTQYQLLTFRTVENTFEHPRGTVVQVMVTAKRPQIDKREFHIEIDDSYKNMSTYLKHALDRAGVPGDAKVDTSPGDYPGVEKRAYTWYEVTVP